MIIYLNEASRSHLIDSAKKKIDIIDNRLKNMEDSKNNEKNHVKKAIKSIGINLNKNIRNDLQDDLDSYTGGVDIHAKSELARKLSTKGKENYNKDFGGPEGNTMNLNTKHKGNALEAIKISKDSKDPHRAAMIYKKLSASQGADKELDQIGKSKKEEERPVTAKEIAQKTADFLSGKPVQPRTRFAKKVVNGYKILNTVSNSLAK